MSKLLVNSGEFENLIAKVANIPSMASVIADAINHINKGDVENYNNSTLNSKFIASSLSFVLEEYAQRLSDDFYKLFDTARGE